MLVNAIPSCVQSQRIQIKWAFPEKMSTPLLRISMENSRVIAKVVEIPGGTPKIEEKTWISRGVNAKKWKIPGETR